MENIISSTCLSAYLYNGTNFHTPLAWSLFMDDDMYFRFLENYDHYVSLTPTLKIIDKDVHFSKQINGDPSGPYVIMELEDVEIHWIHTNSIDTVLDNWNRRLERSKGLNKIFIHITPEFKKIYSETERKNLIDRFCNINEFTILLTERPEEEVSTKNYVIKCINRWIGHSQENRTPNGDACTWYTHDECLADIKQIIKEI
jgi:uncharacterized protein (DUF1919 family)